MQIVSLMLYQGRLSSQFFQPVFLCSASFLYSALWWQRAYRILKPFLSRVLPVGQATIHYLTTKAANFALIITTCWQFFIPEMSVQGWVFPFLLSVVSRRTKKKQGGASIFSLNSARINKINLLFLSAKWVTDGPAFLQVAEIAHYSPFNLSGAGEKNKMPPCSYAVIIRTSILGSLICSKYVMIVAMRNMWPIWKSLTERMVDSFL